MRNGDNARHEDERRDADTLPDVNGGDRVDGEVWIGEPARLRQSEPSENGVDHAVERVEQRLVHDADTDGRDQYGKEHDSTEITATDDGAGEQDRQEEPDNDLGPRGDKRVDQGVGEAGVELRILEELSEVVKSDEVRVEQRPPGQ